MGPDPFSIWTEVSYLGDRRPGNDGVIGSLAGLVTLNVAPDLPGDFNFDGSVDAADYVVWRKGIGIAPTQDKYIVWRTNFGQSLSFGTGTGTATSSEPLSPIVPEPASALLLSVGIVVISLLARPFRAEFR